MPHLPPVRPSRRPPVPGPRHPGRSSRATPRRSAWRWTPRSPRSAAAWPATGAACGCAARCGGPGPCVAVVAVAELALAVLQRLLPLEQAPLVALALPGLGLLVLLVLVVRARPTLGETALAVDAEGGAGDAVASALAFAGSMPSSAGPATAGDDETIAVGAGFDLHDAEARFVRRQRRDALSRLRAVDPGLFRPRLARRPALIALIATALVVPAVLLPNPQDLVIAQQREIRAEAERQAEHIDEVAKEPRGQGRRRQRPPHAAGRGAPPAGRAPADEPGRARPEPGAAGRRRGRRARAAGRGQRAAGGLARVALPVALAHGHAATPRRTPAATRRRPTRTSRSSASRSTR